MTVDLGANVAACHACPHRQRGVEGMPLCLRNGVPFARNAERGACPDGRFGDAGPPPYPSSVPLTVRRTRGGIVVEDPPAPTAQQVASFARAATTGTYVPADVQAEREATCRGCALARYSPRDAAVWCSVCGCRTGGLGRWRITNLAAYVETEEWGCKHPDRAGGGGWRR